MIAFFPVYRVYVREGSVTALDRRYVEWAVARAKKTNHAVDVSIYDFIKAVLLLDAAAGMDEGYQAAVTALAMKVQQLTSPVMAKGCEDTAFYRYHRLTSLNEVGGEPLQYFASAKAFHAENHKRLEYWPHAMLNSATHDSKRGEDVRARINVISEMPVEWQRCVRRWRHINRHHKLQLADGYAPSANDEYLLYQTLIGTWPLQEMDAAAHARFVSRVEAYMIKAAREAKQYTSWSSQSAGYENALSDFIRRLLEPLDKNIFLTDFLPLQKRIARFGLFNSLSQVMLKMTSPGVPDVYQGNELWEFSLVDPDNRRPVDYAVRDRMLADMEQYHSQISQEQLSAHLRGLVATIADGRAKLYVTWRLLRARRHWPRVFQAGTYQPFEAVGARANHLISFARSSDDFSFITVAPRWISRLVSADDGLPLGEAVWSGTAIDVPQLAVGARGINMLTGETVEVVSRASVPALPVEVLLGTFPVALLRFDAKAHGRDTC
ncbi:MAG: hypothetical protein AB1810_10810 [Pseudomonadota bacterium]